MAKCPCPFFFVTISFISAMWVCFGLIDMQVQKALMRSMVDKSIGVSESIFQNMFTLS